SDGLLYLQIVVFSKDYCPHCKKTQKAINSFQLKENSLEWIEINKRSDGDAIQDYLVEITGARVLLDLNL
ncbi:unnamed protein product, partial [Dracunculus medinensis]|uniref:Glutaredoxin-1 n=1 Tax=Dracunculus medinensis TaxID=318479 RepID=A0A0N4UNS8_DRAME